MFRIERHPHGPRVYAFGLRLHHGLTGCALVFIGLARRQPHVLELGLALVAHDLTDFPWRLHERA